MNYHESRPALFFFPSRCVNRLCLGIERLSLGALATNRAESLQAEFLPRRHDRIQPFLCELLEQGLALGVLLLRDNPAALVLHQVRLVEAGVGLLLPGADRERDAP